MSFRKGENCGGHRVPVVGITGGIGCGKSAAAGLFGQWGAAVIDADTVGREVLQEDHSLLSGLVNEFGKDILQKDGSLNRSRLAEKAFSGKDATLRLNNIMHPPMIAAIRRKIFGFFAQNPKMIVVEAAVIYESGTEACFDAIICVSAPMDIRIKRTGLSPEDFSRRQQVQVPESEKESRADYNINNAGSISELDLACREVFMKILREYS